MPRRPALQSMTNVGPREAFWNEQTRFCERPDLGDLKGMSHSRFRILVRNVAVRFRGSQDIALAQIPFEEFRCHSVDHPGCRGIVTRSFITHKCVSTIEFVPAEYSVRIRQRVVNDRPSLARHVRILAAKNEQQLAMDLRNAIERIVIQSFAKTALMYVGRITAGRCQHLRIHRRSKCKMAAKPKPHNPQL